MAFTRKERYREDTAITLRHLRALRQLVKSLGNGSQLSVSYIQRCPKKTERGFLVSTSRQGCRQRSTGQVCFKRGSWLKKEVILGDHQCPSQLDKNIQPRPQRHGHNLHLEPQHLLGGLVANHIS